MYERKCLPHFNVQQVKTVSYDTQNNSGNHQTVGLERPVEEFYYKHYAENYIQAVIDSRSLKSKSVVIGGSGDTLSKIIGEKAVQICAANEVETIYIGRGCLFIKPAISYFIRKYELDGGIFMYEAPNLMDRSVNFGIQYIADYGGAAPFEIVDKFFEISRNLKQYKRISVHFPLEKVHEYSFQVGTNSSSVTVHIVDPIKDYLDFLKISFDFPKMRGLLTGTMFTQCFEMLINCKNGGAGLYAQEIFEKELGAKKGTVVNYLPSDDYNKKYFSYGVEYSLQMTNELINGNQDMGVVIDGSGSRTAMFAKGALFIPHGDSFAIIVEHSHCMPLFQRKIVKGIARTLYLTRSVDPVAHKLGLAFYETPDGWRFFNFLMDNRMISLCADGDFSMGGYYIRDRDGILPILAWLSIIAHLRKPIKQILIDHWTQYGRNFTSMYQYNQIPRKDLQLILDDAEFMITHPQFRIKQFNVDRFRIKISNARLFEYVNPVNNIPIKDEGILVLTHTGRIVIRTIMYGAYADIHILVEELSKDISFFADKLNVTLPLAKVAMYITNLPKHTQKGWPDFFF